MFIVRLSSLQDVEQGQGLQELLECNLSTDSENVPKCQAAKL